MLLTTSEAIASFCQDLRSGPFVTVDTEFLSEKRFRPLLCLIQLGTPGHAAAIDPLVPGLDLTPVAEILGDPNILKVFHAGSQDVGIFLHVLDVLPAPLLDTQVMASVCGFGNQVGYASLCSQLLGVQIDKTNQATDWSLRPLTDDQVEYAIGDVTHLCHLFTTLSDKLEEMGRSGWIAEEHAALANPASYALSPDEAWRRIRVRRPKPRTLAVLRALASWREKTASRRNKPRGWVVHDDALVEIAEQLPTTPQELERVRRLGKSTASGGDGRQILAEVEQALASPKNTWPKAEAKPNLTGGQKALVLVLQALLELRCAQHDVGTNLVAVQSELRDLVLGQHDGVRALTGWRAEVFGTDALALLAGELRLTGSADGAVAEG
ncbi:MAG: ribonuclease D [Myxococcota bacterium]